MTEAGILDGDCVVVRHQPRAANGDIVVALLDGETTVKELELKAGWGEYEGMRLLPANEAYVPIEVSPDRIVILGVVVTVLRRYYPRSGPGV
jgi:repressor LexA